MTTKWLVISYDGTQEIVEADDLIGVIRNINTDDVNVIIRLNTDISMRIY